MFYDKIYTHSVREKRRNRRNSTAWGTRTAYESRNTKSPDLVDRNDRTRHRKTMWKITMAKTIVAEVTGGGVAVGEAALALSGTAPLLITSGIDLPIVMLMH